jgi:hypothetical protein
MTEEKELSAFASYLHEEVLDRALGDVEGAEFEENAFVALVTDHLAEIGMIDNPIVCFHQGRIGNRAFHLNGYASPDDGERVDLIIAAFDGANYMRKMPAEEVSRSASLAASSITAAKRSIHERMEKASDAYSMMSQIADLLQRGTDEVRVLIIANGMSSVKRIKPAMVEGLEVKFEIYDLKRLMRTMASGQGRDVIEIDLEQVGLEPIPCVAMPVEGGTYEAYLAIFPGEALFRLYEEYGSRLLEYNVRAFLQATGKVNRGIRDTLRSEPEYFMAYNNGISMTVDDMVVARSPESGLQITHMKGLQIVNGGQTTASIHRARKRDRISLARVHVPAKITRLPSERIDEMIPKISRYANTQNVIQEADFSSNEPFHIALERLSESIWTPGAQSRWFYERARGQYRTAMNKQGDTPARLRVFRERTPPSQRFSKTDLAKFVNSWERLPHLVSSGAQKNFVTFMRSLREARGKAWEPDEAYYQDTIGRAILFRAATGIVRSENFPAYRANIVAYLVAYLSHRTAGQLNFNLIWRQQSLSTDLVVLLRVWSHSVAEAIQESAEGRNVTEWCKKEGCWSAVKEVDLSLPDDRPPELWSILAVGEHPTQGALLSPEDQNLAAECMKLSAEQWFALHQWGRESGRLKDWQSGIAHTLSGYASGGWRRIPSAKQARQATRILEIARQEGFWPGTAHGSED